MTSFERVQQQSPERSVERAASYQASRRMSEEVHHDRDTINFSPRSDRESSSRDMLQHAIYRTDPQGSSDSRRGVSNDYSATGFDRRHSRDHTDRGHNRSPLEILRSAVEGVGHQLWARTPFAGVVRGGRLGCAAAVSERLQNCGFPYANDAGVGGLVDRLMKNGWTRHPISESRPGDVIYGHRGAGWRNGGGNAHIGIMGENGQAFHNSSASGRWTGADADRVIGAGRFGQNRFCLRPPGGGDMPAQVPPGGEPGERQRPADRPRPPKTEQPPILDGRNVDSKVGVIMDGRSATENKLAAIRELSHQGVAQIRFQGADGQTYSMRTEMQAVGSKEMVHLFITMPDGREKVVLRGIARQDGSFEQQKSADGKSVDYYGRGAGMVYGYGARASDRESPSDRTRPPGPQNGPSDQQNPSLYQRYRREQDRRENSPDNSFREQAPRDDIRSGTLSQMMDEAQKSANNVANRLVRTPLGVYMRAGMTIDADGSPRARQIDPTGQSRTSMRYTDGSSVNAEVVPYMVLPGGQYQQFGIKIGDMCLVRNRENGKMAIAVFADVGPRHKRGEGSMALASELGINPSPTRGGISSPSIEYLVLPGSGYPVQNQEQLMARIRAQQQRLGIR